MKKTVLFTLFVFLFVVPISAYAQTPNIVFSAINVDGLVPGSEADEWIEIQNLSGSPVNLNGWTITANDDGQNFDFPAYAVIQANQTCRVYTNQNHDGCSFNWGSGRPIWNNNGDCARLYSASGTLVSSFCYDGGIDEGTPQYPNNPAPQPQPQPQPPTGGGGGGQPCPSDGAWPAGCVPGGSSAPAPQPPSGGGGGGQACPTTGAWPAGCVPGGAPTQPPSGGGGGGQACPTTGAWPAGCVPGGAPTQPPSSGGSGQPCPASGAWPAGCTSPYRRSN